jgi:predicted acetyltransferase
MPQRCLEVRSIEESLEEYTSIAVESLLVSDPDTWRTYIDRIGPENVRGVYDGARLAGGLAFYRMGQWFGGKELPCAGVSGVAISAADRGSGACGELLRSLLVELHAEGMPIASLYASTQSLYRKVGFEHAGTQTQYSIPIQSIGSGDRSLPVHRFRSPPIDKLDHVARRRAVATNGHLGRTEGLWQRLLCPHGASGTITYLLGDAENPEGYAIFRTGSRDGGVPQPLVSTDVAANTPAALRRLLTLVRDHRSMCDSFQWYGSPNDPIHFLAEEQWVTIGEFMRWMLRIVDLPKALQGRGYDKSVTGELHLEINDPLLPQNSGRWLVRVAEGNATAERGGSGSLAMDVRALAPLYSSLYSADELVSSGAIRATDTDQIRLANRVFAGPAPWMTEIF